MRYLKICLFVFASQCLAQSTPSEFAEMSLQQLFDQSIYESDDGKDSHSPWTLTYQFKSVEFEGYLDGTNKLSFDDVLWSPSSEVRTATNFPVVPTTIRQKAHTIALGYEFNSRWNGHISIPYIRQETDHISIIGGYENFVLETAGVGDASVSATYNWGAADEGVWRLSLGVSLPTGSIDEGGDTPRAPGDQQLPYTMQLGSGTYDFPAEFSYTSSGTQDFNVGISANIRTGTNDRGYRLGNNYSLNSRYKIDLSPTLQTSASLNFQYSRPIHGQDESLLVNAPIPYPAGITNPNLYGGKKVNLRLGVLWKFSKNYAVGLEVGKPIYQNLNGPQPKEKWRTGLSISKSI